MFCATQSHGIVTCNHMQTTQMLMLTKLEAEMERMHSWAS
jgi:hypothetical protein